MFADTDWGSPRGSTGSCWDWPPLVSHLSPTSPPSCWGACLEPRNWLELGVGAMSSPGWQECPEEIVSACPKTKIIKIKIKRAERNLLGLSNKKWIWVFQWQYLCCYKWWLCTLVQRKSSRWSELKTQNSGCSRWPMAYSKQSRTLIYD